MVWSSTQKDDYQSIKYFKAVEVSLPMDLHQIPHPFLHSINYFYHTSVDSLIHLFPCLWLYSLLVAGRRCQKHNFLFLSRYHGQCTRSNLSRASNRQAAFLSSKGVVWKYQESILHLDLCWWNPDSPSLSWQISNYRPHWRANAESGIRLCCWINTGNSGRTLNKWHFRKQSLHHIMFPN